MRVPPHRLLLPALLLLGACKAGAPVDSAAPGLTRDTLHVSPESQVLFKGQSANLTATMRFGDGGSVDATAEVTWSSSDPTVVEVTAGQLVAVGSGAAQITAALDDLSAVAAVDVEGLSITGDVTLYGWPVGDIRVSMMDGDQEVEVWTDPVDGSFLFGDLAVGSYTLQAWGPNGRDFWEDTVAVELNGDAGPVGFEVRQFGYPSEDDLYSGDDRWDRASSIPVDGALQARSLWPFGAKDWIAVELDAGVPYELFTTALCETCDTFLYLYDTDGQTELLHGDDHINYDSQVTFTPEVDGTYYMMVRPYAEHAGVVNYFLGALTFVDADADGLGAFHDCDDADEAIGAWRSEVPGGAVDEDCDGFLAPPITAEDVDEGANDTIDGAIPLPIYQNSFEEQQYVGRYRERASRTLHDADDVDWYAVTVPPSRYVYLQRDSYADGGLYASYTVYAPDGATEYFADDSYLSVGLRNTTSSDETWYIKVALLNGYEGTWYNLFAMDYGVDLDGDGWYTMDWPARRDCDDADASVGDACYGGD